MILMKRYKDKAVQYLKSNDSDEVRPSLGVTTACMF